MLKYSKNNVILSFLDKRKDKISFKPEDALSIKEGKKIVAIVNENCGNNKEPFSSLDMDGKRKLMAYLLLKRENPVVEKGDSLNFEAAANSLKDDLYKNEKELDKRIVDQSSRIPGFFDHTLAIDSNGKVSVKKEGGK